MAGVDVPGDAPGEVSGAPLRRDLRRFLRTGIDRGEWDPRAGSFGQFDTRFAARLGARGYIGTDWPRACGGLGGTRLDRQIIAEELLAHGAPLRAHWAAERLAGPLLLRFGTPAQQQELLPRIAAGRLSLCIGVEEAQVSAEPTAMQTRALPVPGGWRITGRKSPVADAAEAQRMLLLARTGAPGEMTADRLAGFGLFLVDLALPGITLRPSPGEVVLEDVFLAADRLVGGVDDGLPAWRAVTDAALGGPECWMRGWPLLAGLAGAVEAPRADAAVGRLVAEAFALHHLGLAEAGREQEGRGAAVLALLGTAQAATLAEVAQLLLPEAVPAALAEALRAAQAGASWDAGRRTPRGPAAAPVNVPVTAPSAQDKLLRRTGRILASGVTPELRAAMAAGGFAGELWDALDRAGLPRAGLMRDAGGPGPEPGLDGLLALVRLCAGHAAPLPVAETLLGQYVLARAGMAPPLGPLSLGPVSLGPVSMGPVQFGDPRDEPAPGFAGGLLAGELARLPWARHATAAVIVIDTPEGARTILTGRPAIAERGLNQAGEPRDRVRLADTAVLASSPPGQGVAVAGLVRLGALFRVAAMVGALDQLARLTALHLRQRRADGRRLLGDPGAAEAMAALTAEAAAADAVLAAATWAALRGDAAFEVACAKLRASVAAVRGAALAERLIGAAGVAPDLVPDLLLAPLVRRLRSWQGEFGSEADWAGWIGAAARAAGPEGLWPLLTDGGRMPAGGNAP